MRPVAQADGHDRPRLIDQLVPGVAAVVEDIFVGSEYPVGEPVVAHELPDVFGRIELGRFGRQRHQGDVVGNGELVGEMPTGLIEQQHGVAARFDRLGDLRQMQRHGGGVAARQHQAGGSAAQRADRAEDVGRAGALIVRRRGPGATSRPAPGDLVLLADAGFILEPDFYRLAGCLLLGDLCQAGSEIFLNAATASPSWA
jgi:hypothetical protein